MYIFVFVVSSKKVSSIVNSYFLNLLLEFYWLFGCFVFQIKCTIQLNPMPKHRRLYYLLSAVYILLITNSTALMFIINYTFLKLYLFIHPSAEVKTSGCMGTFLSATPSLSARLKRCLWISVYLKGFGMPPPQIP